MQEAASRNWDVKYGRTNIECMFACRKTSASHSFWNRYRLISSELMTTIQLVAVSEAIFSLLAGYEARLLLSCHVDVNVDCMHRRYVCIAFRPTQVSSSHVHNLATRLWCTQQTPARGDFVVFEHDLVKKLDACTSNSFGSFIR